MGKKSALHQSKKVVKKVEVKKEEVKKQTDK